MAASIASALLSSTAAVGAPLVCWTSQLLLNTSPIPGQDVSECATPPDAAHSSVLYGWADTTDPGSGNGSAGGSIRPGSLVGSAHVSESQAPGLETLFEAQSKGDLRDGLTVVSASHEGAAGTLSVPIHVTGGFFGSAANVPADSPAAAPTISGGFRFHCSGSFVGGCGDDAVTIEETDGLASDPLDESLVMAIPVVFGQPVSIDAFFQVTIGVRGTHCLNCGVPTTTSGIVDANQLGTFGKGTVADADGHPVDDATVISESGYDYLAPEPALPTLELAALGSCLVLRVGPNRARNRSRPFRPTACGSGGATVRNSARSAGGVRVRGEGAAPGLALTP